MASRAFVRVAVLVLACVMPLFADGSPAMAQEKIKLNFRLSWVPIGGWAPYWLALDRGYFADEGLDVTFNSVMGSGTLVKVMAQGSDPIGNPDFGTMMKGVAKGMELKAIFGEFQKTTMVVMSRREKPIRTPKDLIGRSIAMGREESSAQIFPALLAASNVPLDKVTVVHPAEGAKLGLFMNGNVDSITGASNIQAPVIESKGVKLYMFSYGDFGANTLNNGIAANAKWLEKNGHIARKFLKGLTRGWKAAIEDPKAAVEAMTNHYPDQRDQKEILLAQLLNTITLLGTENTKGQPIGWMAKADWEQTQELLLKYGGLEKRMPVEQYYTNEYIPQ